MADIILHHYDISPFAEKIRLALGLKGLAWRSVIQPMVMPKPDLVPLTGGYRRIPVMQIGADIYCDTNRIAAEIERRWPQPTLYPADRQAETALWCTWAERVLMWPTARYVTAVNDDRLGAAFHADRAAMRGHAPPTPAELAAAIPLQREQCRHLLGLLEGILADGRRFLLGEEPGLADTAVFQRVWWLESFGGRASNVLAPLGSVRGWADRVRAIGHGERSEMSAAAALDVARAAEPDPEAAPNDPAHASELIGRRVSVGTEGFAPDPVVGAVVAVSGTSVSIAREDPRLGRLAVHFPRLGYDIKLA